MNPDEMAERIRQLEEQKNNAYAERNSCVALLARMALALGFKAGIWVDAGQPEEWQNVVFIELPAGQISWHVPAGELFKFDFLSHHPSTWDGHTTEEKYNRVLAPGRLSKLA